MVTIEQKIALFSKLIYQDVENEVNKKMQELDEEQSKKLQEVKTVATQKATAIHKEVERKVQTKRNELITRSKIENKRSILRAKEQCIESMMEELKQKVKEFIDTPDYKEYMEYCMKEAMKESDTNNPLQLYVIEQDAVRFQDLLSKTNGNVVVADSAMLGGMMIVNPSKNIRIDLSIRTRLEDIQPLVISELTKQFGEVGEEIE